MIQILGAEAVALRAEQQRRAVFRRQSDDAAGDIARRGEFPVVGARPRRRAGDEAAVADRLGDACATMRAPARMSSAPAASALASACGNERGRTSTRSDERHVLHGARDRADIARDGWDR